MYTAECPRMQPPCAAIIERKTVGDVVLGVAEHLETVHGMTLPAAMHAALSVLVVGN